MDGLRRFSDIIVYNVLFVVCCIPVFTVGASMIALCEGMQRLSADPKADFPVAAAFFDAFKRNIKRGFFLWLVTALGYVSLLLLAYSSTALSGGSNATMYMMSFYIVALLMVFGYQNLFPSAARWPELSAIALVFRSYLVAGAGLFQTFLGILVTSLISGLTLVVNPLAIPIGLMFWGTMGFGITTYLCSGFFEKAAARFEEKLALEEAKNQSDEEEKETGEL